MVKEKVCIYIDGSNFYNKLKKSGLIPNNKRFDYTNFVKNIVVQRDCVSKRYYIGIVSNFDNSAKSQLLVKDQQKFLSNLEKEGFDIKRGKILYDGGRIREKGVDVKIATDLIIGAVDNLYDTAVIISSDTDLIPAIRYIRYKKKKVEYIGFSSQPSIGMIANSDIRRLFTQKELENLFK
ncbi:MAG: NYN domain-containing protein [Patescibacteria group bacterium]